MMSANIALSFVTCARMSPGPRKVGLAPPLSSLSNTFSASSIALAILGDQRWPYKPEIPTMKETGYGKEGGESWYGILAPAGTPKAIVDKMVKAIEEAMKSPDVLEKLDKAGAKPTFLGPADMRAQIDQDSAMFGDIIKRGNVKTQ